MRPVPCRSTARRGYITLLDGRMLSCIDGRCERCVTAIAYAAIDDVGIVRSSGRSLAPRPMPHADDRDAFDAT
jgi:hypothetical protein